MNTTTPTPAPEKKTPRVQLFPEKNAEVRVTKGTGNGTRFAHITYLQPPNPPTGTWRAKKQPRTVGIPVELLSLAAGRDAWMRRIEFKCLDCGQWHEAAKMECELCEKCYEAALEENDRADGRS